jgi:hypothetical protein
MIFNRLGEELAGTVAEICGNLLLLVKEKPRFFMDDVGGPFCLLD